MPIPENLPRLGTVSWNKAPRMEVLSDVQPFTRRDTYTWTGKIEELIAWVNSVTKIMEENGDKLNAAWVEQAEYLISEFNRITAELIEAVVNNSIELQDPVFAELIATDSLTFAAMSSYWSELIIPDPDREGFFLINTPVPVTPGADIEDPDDEGFYIPEGA